MGAQAPAPGFYVPLVASGADQSAIGVLGIYAGEPRRFEDAEQQRLAEAFATQLTLSIERARLAEETERARVQVETEQLRSTLLSSVSHDLRTPQEHAAGLLLLSASKCPCDTPPMSDAPVQPGEVLGGKFRVDKVLGVGGMGMVVAATHLQLEERVALKFMLADTFKNGDALARFQREARAAVRLKSEHVARVLDTGVFENSSPYIVMEFLEGNDLAAELARLGPLPLSSVAEFVIQASDALAEAHALGIVHRDLKPANLFLTRRRDGSPLVKVLDFGISKVSALNDTALAMTSTTAMMGSPLYMSPEQMRASKDADARSDVWSVGVIVYELLAGRVPFQAETLGELMSQVMMDPVKPLASVRTDVPPDVSDLVSACLEKDRERRVQNVAEIATALARHAPPRCQAIVERIAKVLGVAVPSAPSSPSGAVSTQLLSGATPSAHQVESPSSSTRHLAVASPTGGQLPPSSVQAPVLPPSVPRVAETGRSWGRTTPDAGRGRRLAAPVVLGFGAALSLALAAGFWAARRTADPVSGTDSEATPTTVTTAATEAASATPVPTALGAVTPEPSTSPSSAIAASASAVATIEARGQPTSAAKVRAHVPRMTTSGTRTLTAPTTSIAQPTATAKASATAVKKPGILDTSN